MAIEQLGQHAPDAAQKAHHVLMSEGLVVGTVNRHGTSNRSSVKRVNEHRYCQSLRAQGGPLHLSSRSFFWSQRHGLHFCNGFH